MLPLTLGLAACDSGDDDSDSDGGETTGMEATGIDSTTGTTETGEGDADTGTTETGDGDADTGTTETGGDGDASACDNDVGFGHPRLPGETIANITGLTREGEMFNTCSLEGKPIVFDMSAMWCGPCRNLAAYMAGQPSSGLPNVMPYIKSWVESGDIYWVTILAQTNAGTPTSPSDVATWEDQYPNPAIIGITGDPTVEGYMIDDHWPTIHVGWVDYTWLSTDMGDFIQPLIDLYNAA